MQKNLYSNTAGFYDKGNELTNYTYDIDFYKSFVNSDMNVLELGCGTGRITIPLLEKCRHYTGVELSVQMLEILQNKVSKLSDEQQRKIDLVNADMSNFELNLKYDLIIFPGITFQALTTAGQRNSCLECAKKHLAAGGRIILDLFDPDYNNVDNIGKSRLNFEYFDEELNCTIKKYSVIEKHDPEKQLHSMKYTFEISRDNVLAETIEDIFELAYIFEEQANEMFKSNGLTISSLYGWYDLSARDKENKRMLIYVLK